MIIAFVVVEKNLRNVVDKYQLPTCGKKHCADSAKFERHNI